MGKAATLTSLLATLPDANRKRADWQVHLKAKDPKLAKEVQSIIDRFAGGDPAVVSKFRGAKDLANWLHGPVLSAGVQVSAATISRAIEQARAASNGKT
jgi:hypothetical protein